MTFSQIAHVYDSFNDLSVYENWLDFTLNSLESKPKRVLDLACGTGWFTQLLDPFVHEIVGLDIDAKMVEMARQESPAIEFIEADMTDFASRYSNWDLITCFLDSLCFLPNFKAVEETFKEVYQALNPQGVFLFDVWTPWQVSENFDGFEYSDYHDQAALIWHSYSDQELLEVTHELTVFEKQANGLYLRTDVDLHERTYPLDNYIQGLQKAGFKAESIQVFVDYGQAHYQASNHPQADRWFIHCFKD